MSLPPLLHQMMLLWSVVIGMVLTVMPCPDGPPPLSNSLQHPEESNVDAQTLVYFECVAAPFTELVIGV